MPKNETTSKPKFLDNFVSKVSVYNLGQIIELGDGIAKVIGLNDARANELVVFPHDIYGMVFNLNKDSVGIVILGDDTKLKAGDTVKTTGRIIEVAASENLLGRVVDPLARPLDGKSLEPGHKFMPIEKIAPGVIFRQPVTVPLQTGIKAIDSMIPIGRGQRELIIGDRGTGKTTITTDTIINQKGKDVICIYVAIGQKTSRVSRLVEKLKKNGAMDYTIVVAATASDPASLQYLAPYSGCAMGEYFMDKGKDVLVIYDDLTKHAWVYRQLSLLLRRPSGREAYPGDVFYLHSRLLERACRMSDKYGGGSLTALPIIETQAGDVSAYVPTNVISITDGQIYLESDLFFAGIRPALNIGLSVSRVGGTAQIKAMKKVAGRMRLDLAQYRELSAFTQFSADLDAETKKKIDRGARISELLKQTKDEPMPVTHQVISLWMGVNGYLDDIPTDDVSRFETEFLKFIEANHPTIFSSIAEKKEMIEKSEETLKTSIVDFKKDFLAKKEIK